ncbi:MAG TPA: N-formylglutamate amidohydrolase [Woeseiaceae bacterium]|jgi:predicted N-formylglutamate amidohydrolase|nr:N-formylglutamate amidohydrolase [Woeseiaceae bacterium]
MPNDDAAAVAPPALLAADEPLPVTVLNETSSVPILLVCDHASCCLPRALADLGLDPVARRSHLAWDIGAGDLTRRLAETLSATAVLAGYSRLVVDCNRELAGSEAFLEYGDGVAIPGNRGLLPADRLARSEAVYRPYHRAIHEQIRRLVAAEHRVPAVLAVHSFTPVLDGVFRPWEVGVLWDADRRIAEVLIGELRRGGFVVGDNEPYSGRAPQDFTIDHHAEAAGLPHAGIEIRQDLVDSSSGVERMAGVLHAIIERFPSSIFTRVAGPEA